VYLCCYRYQSLVGTIAKKFTKRRHKSAVDNTDEHATADLENSSTNDDIVKPKKSKLHQKKFLKPQDD